MKASFADIDWFLHQTTGEAWIGQIIGFGMAACFCVLVGAVVIGVLCYMCDALTSKGK